MVVHYSSRKIILRLITASLPDQWILNFNTIYDELNVISL